MAKFIQLDLIEDLRDHLTFTEVLMIYGINASWLSTKRRIGQIRSRKIGSKFYFPLALIGEDMRRL